MEAMERKKSLKEGGNKPMGKEAAKGGKWPSKEEIKTRKDERKQVSK